MRGGFGPQDTCQFADLAAAAPGLTSLDLSGNLLTRIPDEDYEYPEHGSSAAEPPIRMGCASNRLQSNAHSEGDNATRSRNTLSLSCCVISVE